MLLFHEYVHCNLHLQSVCQKIYLFPIVELVSFTLLLNSCHFFAFGIGFPDCFGIKLRYRREFWFYWRIWLRISDRLYILGLWAFSWGGNVEQEKLSNLLIPLCFERYFHAKSILITIYKYIYNKFRKSRINKCSRQTFILHKWHTM